MNRPFATMLAASIAFALPAFAADKKPEKRSKPSTVPPKSPMIATPAPGPSTPIEPGRLISSEMSGRDLQFFTNAVQAGRLQAYLVEMITTRADSAQIKALGEMLGATQSEENKQIAKLAALKGWNVSTAPTSAQKKVGAELEKLSGSHFDKAAMDKVIAASRDSIGAYEAAATSTDADIKSFSEQMLPLAQEKLRLVEKMTGAGSKAANELFRKSAPTPETAPPAESTAPSKEKTTPKVPAPTPAAKRKTVMPTTVDPSTMPAPTEPPKPAVPPASKPVPPPITTK